MSRGYPSMTALLARLAFAGYQNRDKIAEMLRGARSDAGAAPQSPQGRSRDAPPGNLGGALSGKSIGDLLSGGIRDLVDAFTQKGHGDVANSWVGHGPNKQIAPPDLEKAIGPDVLENLSKLTGLSREEILSKLSTHLPEAVDKYTPDGRVPTVTEVSK
jgi:uncharacterized protein YidB (DUF937 family)